MSSEKEQKQVIDAAMAWLAPPAAIKEAIDRNATRPAALTKEQRQKIDEAIAPLLASSMRTDPIDRDAAVAAFNAAYAALNLPAPEYEFFASPAEAFQHVQNMIPSCERFRGIWGDETGLGSIDGRTPEIREALVNPKWRPAVKRANRPFDPFGALAGVVHSTLEASTKEMKQWELLHYGNDSGWGNVARNGWLHALPALGIYQLPQDYVLACRALETCGWVFTFERMCLICERPDSFHHPELSKEGPRDRIIVRWRDGFVCDEALDDEEPEV
jgi:hypothetical protein